MEKRKVLAKWSAWRAFNMMLCVEGVTGSLVGNVKGAHPLRLSMWSVASLVYYVCGGSVWWNIVWPAYFGSLNILLMEQCPSEPDSCQVEQSPSL